MRMTLRDFRYAVRSLVRAPGFTAAAALTLALGIGADTAVFSVVDALLLRPLAYKSPDQLVMVWDQLPKLGLEQFPAPFFNYFEYKQRNQVFEDIAAFHFDELNLSATSSNVAPERIEAMVVSANLFPILGVAPQLGRAFTPEENQPGRDDSIILSYGLWTRRFRAERDLIGRTLRINGRPLHVIGIMPPGFQFTILSGPPPDAWIPMVIRRSDSRTDGVLRLIARLKPGVSLIQAQTNMDGIARYMQAAYHPYTGPHGEDAGYRIAVIPLRDQLFGGLRTSLLMLFGAVALVLLIACVNIANLLLIRRSSRHRELAIRESLGASRLRLAGESSAETLLLAWAGGCLGLLLARWSISFLPALGVLPQQAKVALDWRVLSFTFALTITTGILFGVLPTLWRTRTYLSDALRHSCRQADSASVARFRSVLVAVEAGLSVLLLACAGLLLKSFLKLEAVDPGFNPNKVLSMRIALPRSKYRDPNQRAAFYEQALERMRRLPGIISAAAVSQLPLSGGGRGGDPFSIEGRPYNPSGRVPQVVNFQIATADYFRTMEIPLIAGRVFNAHDQADARKIAVINETMARGFWIGPKDAIGKRVLMGAPRPGSQWLTIAGVVGDVRNAGLRIEPIPQLYVPHLQNVSGTMVLVLRTAPDPLSIAVGASRQVSAIDPDQPVYELQTLEQKLAGSMARERFQTMLLAAFSIAALLLAAVGIYGVLAQSVTRRIPEIGIRMALGAQQKDVLKWILRQGMAPAVTGMAAGLAGSMALTRVLRSLLFGVSPTDVPTLAAVIVLFTLVAMAACYLPARRAMRVEPIVALRYE